MSFSLSTSLLLDVLLCLAPSLAHGQNSPRSFYLGARAGYSTYTMEGEEVKLHTRLGTNELQRAQWFTAGVIARKRLYVPPFPPGGGELRSGRGRFRGGYFLGNSMYAIDCLQIPLLLDVKLPAAEHLSVHLQGGMALTTVVRGVQLDMSSFDSRNRFSSPSAFLRWCTGANSPGTKTVTSTLSAPATRTT